MANPLIEFAESTKIGDAIFNKIQYPAAHLLLTKCDAVLRIEGASTGADQDVEIAEGIGLKVYHVIREIPNAEQ